MPRPSRSIDDRAVAGPLMTVGYDAIVIGAGHNGLIAGAFLARTGRRTVVLEARSKVGGAADTSSPWPEHPDFRVSTYSYAMLMMPLAIIRALDLERHGYRASGFDLFYQAYPDGSSVKVYANDAAKSRASIARFSKRDAETMGEWEAWLGGVAAVLGPLQRAVPPRLGSLAPGDLVETARTAWKLRGLGVRGVADVTRLFTMSAIDLLDEWFESEQVKGMLALNSVIGTWAGPAEPGTAYVMLHHAIGDVAGEICGFSFPEGGMGAVSDACRRAAEAFGAEVRVEARVGRILTRDGRATGVALHTGEEISAPVVVTCIHPKIAFLELLERTELPADFVRDVERWRTRSGVVKVNCAISKLPSYRADPGSHLQEHHMASSALGFSPAYIERAFQDAREGRGAEHPFCDGVIPTWGDRTMAPEGVHIMSMFAQWAPLSWAEERHTDELEAFADRVIDGYDQIAPGFKGSVIARQVVGPWDMQEELGLVGGNIFHGELTPDQLFHMRPAPGYADYRTPIRGLYHASSATHAGGGVSGIPAANCFRQIERDSRWRNAPRRLG
ncbi:MAG: NAD(P)/FAD-dependent oxidoreductase [Actinomycetota bacterium]